MQPLPRSLSLCRSIVSVPSETFPSAIPSCANAASPFNVTVFISCASTRPLMPSAPVPSVEARGWKALRMSSETSSSPRARPIVVQAAKPGNTDQTA